ncbi:hypothetical protein KC19_11G098700 [Ceratodon purpureus]|uniref:calcium/calmodulin-dependent protein kinase n=1 Tax=Ceratodon purpureus TaxID=3225 RepID=A0A8T0GCD7_CERPU|nr:hypothetical protein KC19_11G098700 [Ceratodon purpureus]
MRRALGEDYHVGPVLGTGGFAVVRMGMRREDNLQVAIKTLPKCGYGRPGDGGLEGFKMSQAEALVKNEVLVMMRIVDMVSPHPNVIHLIDVYDDEYAVHLVLELCKGGELFDRIVQQRRYSERDAAGVVRQIAAGLAALHHAQVVHRDMKPENCLFVHPHADSPLKIMDFGLSFIHNVTNPVVGIFGSIDYVAPEQLNFSGAMPANDMWSLGVILFILLCGYPPFRAKTSREKQMRILTGVYTMDEVSWRGISVEAKELMNRLLTVDPSARPSASEVLSHPWVSGDTASRELIHEDVFMRFQAFNARRKFRATVYASIVRTKFQLRTKYLKELIGDRVLTESELEDLRVNFIHYSSNGQTATLEEFQKVLCSMKLQGFVPLAPRIFKLFDYNHDGWIDLREVVCGFTSLLRTAHEEDKIRLCFKMYDNDDSGYISKDELALVLGALPEDYLPTDISTLQMDEIFEHIDTDSDGRISYQEFRNAISLQDVIMTHFRAPES